MLRYLTLSLLGLTGLSVLAFSTSAPAPAADAGLTEQSQVAIFKGQIIAADGEPAAGVPITLKGRLIGQEPDTALQQQRSFRTVADEKGNFQFRNVPPNTYRYRAGARGTEEGLATDMVRLQAGKTVEKKIQLRKAG